MWIYACGILLVRLAFYYPSPHVLSSPCNLCDHTFSGAHFSASAQVTPAVTVLEDCKHTVVQWCVFKQRQSRDKAARIQKFKRSPHSLPLGFVCWWWGQKNGPHKKKDGDNKDDGDEDDDDDDDDEPLMMMLKSDVRARLSIDLSGCERSETQMPPHCTKLHYNALLA